MNYDYPIPSNNNNQNIKIYSTLGQKRNKLKILKIANTGFSTTSLPHTT